MKEYHYLLPLATGYFGASSALYNFGGLVVIYGPAGGAWHINIEDEPRWYRGPTTVVGAGILEMDVILGNDDKFIDNIIQTAKDLNCSFVALSGTPISEITGTDLNGFVRTIEARTDMPVFMVPTAGSEPYPEGASKALLALADKFMDKDAPKKPNGVNLLGAIHLSTGEESHLEPLFNAIKDDGFELVGVLSALTPDKEDPIKGLRMAPGAEINAVVSTSGLELAERMYEDFGIPFVAGMPVGVAGREAFLSMLNNKRPELTLPQEGNETYNHALVIGEPVLSYGIKLSLLYDFGLPQVDVISVTPSEPLFKEYKGLRGLLAERGLSDVDTDDERLITELIYSNGVDLVIADPCYKPLVHKDTKFIPMPHLAMSARFNWDTDYEYSVEKGYDYLNLHLNGECSE